MIIWHLFVYVVLNWILAFGLFALLALFHYIDYDLMGFFINPFIINKVVNGKNIWKGNQYLVLTNVTK